MQSYELSENGEEILGVESREEDTRRILGEWEVKRLKGIQYDC